MSALNLSPAEVAKRLESAGQVVETKITRYNGAVTSAFVLWDNRNNGLLFWISEGYCELDKQHRHEDPDYVKPGELN